MGTYFFFCCLISGSSNFTATVFLAYGCFYTVRTFLTFILPSIHSYIDLGQTSIHIVAYIVPIITSTLWTFGFIIMVNQRLNAENFEEKEKSLSFFKKSLNAVINEITANVADTTSGLVLKTCCNRVFSNDRLHSCRGNWRFYLKDQCLA